MPYGTPDKMPDKISKYMSDRMSKYTQTWESGKRKALKKYRPTTLTKENQDERSARSEKSLLEIPRPRKQIGVFGVPRISMN